MANDEQILKEANYYLDNDLTIEQASRDLGISKRTLQLHLKKLESIAPDVFKLVVDKKISNERRGKIKGGTLGKRGPSWTEEDAISIASKMIEKELTYEQAEKEFGIAHTTLHEMMNKGIKDLDTTSLLYALTMAHKKGMSLDDFKKIYYGEHVAIDQVSKDMKEEAISKQSKK